MTLALLLTAATGAWAESKPIGLNVEYAAGDEITSTTDVYVYSGDELGSLKKMGVKITSTWPLTILMINPDLIKLNGDAAVYYLPDGTRIENSYTGSISCLGESTGVATVVHVASGSGTLADPYVFAPGSAPAAPAGTTVDLTRGTGEKINEWTLTNGMPAGNVLLTVAYKDRATMALTYDGTPITTEANAVTAFKGFEQEFAEALTPAVQNIEPTFNSGTAQDVTTTLAADFTFKSSDAGIIGFKSGETYADEGTLDQMEFRALTTSPVTLTVTYKGTDDLESKSQTLLVTIEKKTYTVSLADNTEDADSWKGNVNGAQTDVNLPITKLEGGEKVTLKYNGRLKVKSVTATTDAAPDPLTVPMTIEAITAGSIIVEKPKAGMQYSVNGGTKTTITETTSIEGLKAGDKVQFYGDGTDITCYGYSSWDGCTMIKGSGEGFTCKVYGNIMSLLDEKNFATATTLSDDYTFKSLFLKNSTLTDASGLLLPATQLAESCYHQMFFECTALTAAPALPATQLADHCYEQMFSGCSALTAAPVLPATKLVYYCYTSMFNNCSNLATVTCLATSGINKDSSTYNWIWSAGSDVQGTKTVYTASDAIWPLDDPNGIPTDWTRVNIDN